VAAVPVKGREGKERVCVNAAKINRLVNQPPIIVDLLDDDYGYPDGN